MRYNCRRRNRENPMLDTDVYAGIQAFTPQVTLMPTRGPRPESDGRRFEGEPIRDIAKLRRRHHKGAFDYVILIEGTLTPINSCTKRDTETFQTLCGYIKRGHVILVQMRAP